MINKDFLEGLAIGALRCEKSNMERGGRAIVWDEEGDGKWRLVLSYACGHSVSDLCKLESIMKSFCHVDDIVVWGSEVIVYITDDDTERG